MLPDKKGSSSLYFKSGTSIESNSQDLTKTEHEELTSPRTEVKRLQTETNAQLINIKTNTDTIQKVESELANVKAELDKECQIRGQLEVNHKKAFEQIDDAHKRQIRCNNEALETKERHFLERKEHFDRQLKNTTKERNAFAEEKQYALMRYAV
ncbi:hypothetical protein DPMN_044364 [Dreissena polymorpha]|uniref:Uncharacterized protein n=1 Tax=Dreissena polymorpha TaxID=45954 RepID=A0A9D4HWE9_DREPO|nr:hypothetical protein DPMN_044364 [Dreissena polymorpha]